MDRCLENQLMQALLQKNYLQYDVNHINKKYRRSEFINNDFSLHTGEEDGVTVRVLDKNYRYVQVNFSSPFTIEECIATIELMLKTALPDKNRKLYCEYPQNRENKGDYCLIKGGKNLDLSILLQSVKNELEDQETTVLSANISYVEEKICYWNASTEIDSYKKNYGVISLVISVRDSAGNCHMYIGVEDLDFLINSYNIFISNTKNKLQIYMQKQCKKIREGLYDVVFSKSFFYYLFHKHYIREFYHLDEMKMKYSPFVNLTDSGILENGFNTRPFDYEGTITKKTSLLRSGKKVGSLVSMIQAEKYEKSPTGNMIKENIEDEIKLEFTNLMFDIQENHSGEYIYVNTSGTGEITNVFPTTFAILIKNNKKIPLEQFNINLNFEELFQKVSKIPESYNHIMGMYFPDIVFKNVKVFY